MDAVFYFFLLVWLTSVGGYMFARIFGGGKSDQMEKRKDKEKVGAEEEELIISIPKGNREFDSGIFGATIQKGFAKLFKDDKLSDITLIVGDEKIPAHKLVLCAWSDTFRAMLDGANWAESEMKELKINVEEEDNDNFKYMLEYMYTGNSAFIDESNVMPLISLANYYGIHALKEVCGKLLGQQISESNIFYLLDLVDKYDCTQLAVQCGKYLACNFMTMWREPTNKERMLSLSVDTWAGMFQSDDLLIPSEQELYEVMVEYASQFKDENKQIAVYERLLPYIRLSLLSMKFLTTVVEKNRLICKLPILPALLFETYRYKAYPYVVPKVPYKTSYRNGLQRFDTEKKGNTLQISEDGLKGTWTNGSWEAVRVLNPFSTSYVYCEFKCATASNVMIGVMVGTVNFQSYPGQYANGYCVHNQGGTHYHAGSSSTMSGMSFTNNDRVGVGFDYKEGKLKYYKNGNFVASFNLDEGTDINQTYASVACASSNVVSVVNLPPLPSDLEHLVVQRTTEVDIPLFDYSYKK